MDAVRFGIFDHVERTEVPLEQLYEDRLRLLQDADAAGVYGYHVAEHHATPLGMAPSPGIFLTAVAQRTRRIHIGPLVYLLPLYNPLRLVNEIAMLDQLSGGRFEIGVGRGVSPYELAYYRIPFYESREMFEEALAVVGNGLRNEHLTHHGHYYKYDSVPIELHTKQRPNPPFWYGVSTEDSFRFAGRHNMHMVGNGPNAMLAKLIPVYRESREQHLGSADSLKLNSHVATPTVGAIRHFFVADTDREADEIARPAYKVYYDNIQKLWRDHRVIVPLFVDDVDRARKIDVAIVGSPGRVRDDIARFFEQSGCNYLVLSFAWGSLTSAQYRRSFELFATKVMPEFTKAIPAAAAD
jgi:alkanesulfonate monooxygenase SsuD/methylene tetrahydromethanopterin reductase-like flavin-dependent oxidoreductase (luciferase family)